MSSSTNKDKREPKQSQGLSQETVEAFASLFKGRNDCWGKLSTPTGLCIYETVTLEHYRSHLKGETSLGVYFNLDDSTCHFAAIDIDDFSFDKAKAVRAALKSIGIPVYIASSKSNHYHVFLFAKDRFISKEIRRVLIHVRDELGIKTDKGRTLEVFPKQGEHHPDAPPSKKYPNGKKYPGSYINLPCFGATRPFLAVNNDGAPQEVPLKVALEQIKQTPNEVIREILKTLPEEPPEEETKKPKQEYKEQSREFYELAVTKLLKSCAFMHHCQADADSLSEPDWYAMITNLVVFGELGREKVHELSKPYYNYSEEETDEKIAEAVEAIKAERSPQTCEYIEQDLGFACSADCLARKQGIKSPAGLAHRLATPKTFHLTDTGNAERLTKRYGDILHYSEVRKKWLIWNGKIWQWNLGSKIMALSKRTALAIYTEAAKEADDEKRKAILKHAAGSEKRDRRAAMVDLSISEPDITIELDELDSNPWLFSCKNGTVDLQTGKLLPHNKEDLITKMSPVEYDPNAQCPLWQKFLARITDNDTELQGYLQRAAGYSMCGDTRAQVLFFLYGAGNNGKSTFLNTINKIIADYSHKAPMDIFATRGKYTESHNESLANLQGKRFVYAGEVEEGRRLRLNLIKDITGGEPIRADRKYEHEVQFQPTFKLWLYGNHKPFVVDNTIATWRRLREIPFTVVIPDDEIDQELPKKLEAEQSGILAWMVQGCLDWQRGGLSEPAAVSVATNAYRAEMDILREFIEDCCIIQPTATVTKKEFYKSYKQWCEDNNTQPITKRTFGTRLGERGISDKKVHDWFWCGIRLNDTAQGTFRDIKLGNDRTSLHGGPEGEFSENSKSMSPNVPPRYEKPTKCPECGGPEFWKRVTGEWVCAKCHPDPNKNQQGDRKNANNTDSRQR